MGLAIMSDSALRTYLVELDEPISKENETGRGCYGAIYKSKLSGAKCVVKKLHDILTGSGGYQYVSESQWEDVVVKFKREIELLSKQRHPNIVQFLGVYGLDGDPRDICLVMEQLDTDLKGYIETYKGSISLSIKLSILKDVACGVSHLHCSGIVHRDLNAGNVLITSSLQAKVADLGVSRIVDSRPMYLSGLSIVPGAIDYMPPEALRQKPVYGPKLDCFSFGHLTLYLAIEVYPQPCELVAGEIDFKTGDDGQLLTGLQVQKRREWFLKLGNDHPLDKLIRRCVDDSPEVRPAMATLREELEEILLTEGEDCIPNLFELSKKNRDMENTISLLQKQVSGPVTELQLQHQRDLSRLEEEHHHIRLKDAIIRQKNEVIQQKDETIHQHEARIVDLQNQLESRPWILEREEVEMTDEKLGAGAYGEVKVAIFRGTRVAAKCLHEIIVSTNNKRVFIQEMDILSKIYHPNIVQFIGATRVDNPILLYELMATTLHRRLYDDESFTHPQITEICCDIASALCYLHQWKPDPIIHGDVSSPNVLMEPLANNRWRSKLCDFGSASHQLQANTVIPGNPVYAAPEADNPRHHTPAMDVYSFGILAMEMTLHDALEMDRSRREEIACTIDWIPMKELVLNCIKNDRNQRLTSVQLLRELMKNFNRH